MLRTFKFLNHLLVLFWRVSRSSLFQFWWMENCQKNFDPWGVLGKGIHYPLFILLYVWLVLRGLSTNSIILAFGKVCYPGIGYGNYSHVWRWCYAFCWSFDIKCPNVLGIVELFCHGSRQCINVSKYIIFTNPWILRQVPNILFSMNEFKKASFNFTYLGFPFLWSSRCYKQLYILVKRARKKISS